jgi:Flp pilus assembly protein TadG
MYIAQFRVLPPKTSRRAASDTLPDMFTLSTMPRRALKSLLNERGGSTLVEAAFAVPLLVLLLLGILAYGSWFMTAHSLQQAANDAARAAVAGLTGTERRQLIDQSLLASRTAFPVPGAGSIAVSVSESSGFCTVTLRYNLANAAIFAAVPFPLPGSALERSAVVRISG